MNQNLDGVSFFFQVASGLNINTNKNNKLFRRQRREESDSKLQRISCVVQYLILNLHC